MLQLVPIAGATIAELTAIQLIAHHLCEISSGDCDMEQNVRYATRKTASKLCCVCSTFEYGPELRLVSVKRRSSSVECLSFCFPI
jgi:hypothetical protein